MVDGERWTGKGGTVGGPGVSSPDLVPRGCSLFFFFLRENWCLRDREFKKKKKRKKKRCSCQNTVRVWTEACGLKRSLSSLSSSSVVDRRTVVKVSSVIAIFLVIYDFVALITCCSSSSLFLSFRLIPIHFTHNYYFLPHLLSFSFSLLPCNA